nr:MAG TPA: hypothetical protein [Caudoviricetes sp.]
MRILRPFKGGCIKMLQRELIAHRKSGRIDDL